MERRPTHTAIPATTPPAPGDRFRSGFWQGQDWAATALGDPATWPAPLRFAASMVLDSPLPMLLAWGDELALFYNEAYATILADKHPQAAGAPLRAVWDEVWPDVGALVGQALDGHALYREDLPLSIRRHGRAEDTWFTFSYTPLRDEADAVRGLACTVRETTAAVRAQQRAAQHAEAQARQEALSRETTERYRLARHATNDAIWDWRLADGLVIWNRALHELFGHDQEQTSAAWWLEHIHPEDRGHVEHSIHAVIDGDGSAWSCEYRFLRADGSYAEIFDRGTVLRDDEGRPLRMIGAMLDLSERKATERALRESERLFRTLFASIDEGFCVIEFLDGPHGPLSDYVHVMANPAYAANAGIDDVVGQRMREIAPLEADGWVEIYRRVLVGGEPLRFERALERTGRYLELAALRIEPAERRQVAVLFKDITRRHREELAMRDMNDTLERRVAEEMAERVRTEETLRQAQKMEAVGQLTGGIAHDFNNMLAVISNALELMGRRMAAGDERALQLLGMAKGGVKRAAQLTQRLLVFSRQQPLRPEPVNANALVRGMSELLLHSLGPGVAFDTAFAPALWSIHADPNQLENAILNLAVNARDALHKGGRLSIATANLQLDAAQAAAHGGPAAGDWVTIDVRDTGAGMSAAVQARAFEPFFTTKEVGRGTGLGLSQVYGFVRQSGGHVRIESAPDQGTTVRLYLPRYAGAPDETPRARPQAPALPGHAHEAILVVEDEDAVRVLLVAMLAELGYRAYAADGAAAALRVLAAHPGIALMITDVVMPEVNGRELADAALKRYPQLKVLFTTGYTRSVMVTNGVLDQDVELIGKPFVIEELAARLRRLLDGPAQA